MSLLVLGYLALGATVLVMTSFAGAYSPAQVWDGWNGTGDGKSYSDWLWVRVQPIAYAALVGAVLALTGTVFQAVLRNPLAEPYILGISGAASLGTVIAKILGPAGLIAGTLGVPLSAFGGAMVALMLLLGLASWARLHDPPTLILCGAVLNAIFGAMILLLYSVAPPDKVVTNLFWVMGTISPESALIGLGGHALSITFAVLAAGTLVFMVVARNLDLLSLGEEEAADLGISPRRFRIVVLAIASLLTGVVVAVAGPIGFAGLVVPHIMRRLHGSPHRRLIPLSLLGGAIFLMVAYALMRAVPGYLFPLGAVTALVGGPFFLFLLVRHRAHVVAGEELG